jgi:hypothetical protein
VARVRFSEQTPWSSSPPRAGKRNDPALYVTGIAKPAQTEPQPESAHSVPRDIATSYCFFIAGLEMPLGMLPNESLTTGWCQRSPSPKTRHGEHTAGRGEATVLLFAWHAPDSPNTQAEYLVVFMLFME